MKEQQQSPYLKMTGEDGIDVIQKVKDYLRYWPWFILSTVVFMLLGYLYLRYTPKIYQTTAKIKIIEEGKGLDLPMEGGFFNNSYINLENEIEILTSYRMLEKVEKELQLHNVFYAEGDIRVARLDTLPFTYKQITTIDSVPKRGEFKITVTKNAFEVYNVETDSTTQFANHDTYLVQHNLPFQIKIESQEQLESCLDKTFIVNIGSIKSSVLNLKGALTVTGVGDSEVLQLVMNGESVSRSERILNAVIKAFNEDGIEDRQLISRRTLEFIDERFIFLSEELDSIEIGKKEFKQANDLITIESDAGISLQSEVQVDDEVFRIENQLALAQLLVDAMNNPDVNSKLLPANFGLESTAINGLIEKFNATILNSEKLISSGGVNNPVVRQLQLEIGDLRDNINNSLAAFKSQLQLTQRQLTSRDKRFKSEVYNLPKKEKLLRAIERQQTIKESLFLLLLQKREEASISIAVTEPSIKVVEYAISSSYPIAPVSGNIYLGALILGLFLPFIVMFVIFFLDDRIHGKNDMERLIGDIPITGEIPKIKDATNSLFSNPNDRSMLAESFRILSSNINYLLSIRDKGNVIYTTSTIKGEGKTFISLNLSLALSSINKKVLLIGADLRNPQLHLYLDIDKNQSGLSNYLHDTNMDWKGSIIKGFKEHPHHDTLISGIIPPNPPHLLTNGRFEELLEEAKAIYDYIIIDTAPTIAVTDTLLISKFADATIYVTRANYSKKNLLEHSNALSKNQKLKNMAYVINQVGANSGYGYSYGYNYGYGYGYSEDEIKESWWDKVLNRKN